MAKPKPRTFVKTIDGGQVVQVAYTPGDAVALSFNGWREQLDDTAATRAAPTTAKAASAGAGASRKAAATGPDKTTK